MSISLNLRICSWEEHRYPLLGNGLKGIKLNLHGTSFPHILNDKICDKIEEYYIGIYVSTILFILSLLNNCNCCGENISKIFSFITPYIYFTLVIVSNIYIYIN